MDSLIERGREYQEKPYADTIKTY